MHTLFRLLRGEKRRKHAYEKLNMGLVNHYSHIIPKEDLARWVAEGWTEAPYFRDFRYAPGPNETIVLSKPRVLAEIDPNTLVGKRVVNCNFYGTYGMGNPSFFGLVLDETHIAPGPVDERDVFVFAIWGADEHTLVDERIVACHPAYYHDYRPWLQFTETGFHDELRPILLPSTIVRVDLAADRCVITVIKDTNQHIIEFLKNDPRLPPRGNGTPRNNAFATGVIADYLFFQKEQAVLHLD